MSAPTTRSQARELLRVALLECSPPLPDDLQDAAADLLLEQVDLALHEGASELERKMLDPVLKLVGSARINLRSIEAFRHLQRFAPDALTSNNREPTLDRLINAAIEDIRQAAALDDRIPF